MNITKKVITTLVLTIFIICIAKISYATTGIVTADSLNLRESPSTSADVITTVKRNNEIEILNQEGVWYQVKVNDITGYVHGDYIQIKEEPKTVDEPNNPNKEEEKPSNNDKQNDIKLPETITVSKEIDIYILPLINATKISKTNQNETLSILGSTNKWLYVSGQNVNGWILKSLVSDIIGQDNNTNINNENNNVNNDENNTNNESQNENTSTENQNEDNTQNTEYEERVMYVNASSIYVRKGPGTNYDYIDTLVLNNSVTVIGEEDDWYKVRVDDK